MRNSTILLAAFAILLAACSSSPNEPDPRGPSAANGGTGTSPTAATIPDVTGRAIRIEWRNLKPKHGEQSIGIINRTSPELAQLYRNPKAFAGVKPVDDEVMGNILAAFREAGFFGYAEAGFDVRSWSMGDGNGVLSLTNGDETQALFLPYLNNPDSEARARAQTYRDLKVLLMNVYNATLWLAPSSPQDPNRAFRAPSPDRRR
jgi:hypothetical protein